jgi:diguanylate cyclase (GGDEF)-like protein
MQPPPADPSSAGADPALIRLYAGIGKLIASSLDLHQVLEGIMEEVRQFFHPENWSMMRLDENTSELFFVIAEGIDLERLRTLRLRSGEGIAGFVAQQGEAVFVPDAASDPRFSRRVDDTTGFVTRSVMAVPLSFQGRVYGVIELVNRFDGTGYTEQDFIVIRSIADFAAIALANSALYEKTRQLAYRDPLTGVFNRARLEALRGELSGRRADERSCVITVIDLDDFKLINDRNGHRAGDRALCFIAHCLQILIRGTDRVFRIGGDEFLVLIHTADPTRLPKILERIEAGMRQLQKKTAEYEPAFTFSFGLSSGPVSEFDAVTHRADMDMYSRKKNAGMQP